MSKPAMGTSTAVEARIADSRDAYRHLSRRGAFGGEFRRPATLNFTLEFDLVAGHFAGIDHFDAVALKINVERYVIAINLSVGYRVVTSTAGNAPSELISVGLEIDGHGLSVSSAAWDFRRPFPCNVRSQRHDGQQTRE
jgi:hypothetical protein